MEGPTNPSHTQVFHTVSRPGECFCSLYSVGVQGQLGPTIHNTWDRKSGYLDLVWGEVGRGRGKRNKGPGHLPKPVQSAAGNWLAQFLTIRKA